MKICITGASGLIGRSLLGHLNGETGLSITALTRTLPASGQEGTAKNSNVRWMRCNLGSIRDCEAAVEDQDVVVHLAHTNSPFTSDRDMPSDALLNLVPTLNLLQAIQKTGCRPRVIYPSSGGGIYGASSSNSPFHEAQACQPNSSYGIQKLAAEHYLRLSAERGYLTATVLRIANAYGWLLSPERQQGFIGTALYQALIGRPVRIFGNPHNVRDYVHIEDILRALHIAMGRREPFEIFNIGTGIGTTVAEIVALIGKTIDQPVTCVTEDHEQARFLPGWCVLDINNARAELAWEPRITLEEGLRRMVRMAGALPGG